MSDILNNKINFRMFLDLLELFLMDIVNKDGEINFCDHRDLIQQVSNKMVNIAKKVELVIHYKSLVELNANLKLLLDSLIINLKGE